MHLVLIGDIGPLDGMIHIGDEAMFDEAVRQLRRRGVDQITAISSNPADTTARYGVSAVLPMGRGGSADDLRSLVADADGVLVTGGGNLSSVWPTHIVERSTLAQIATEQERPFVLSGQTIGPVLTGDGREMVARMLASARLVGLREAASAALVAGMGVPAARMAHTVDDASFLADGREQPTALDARLLDEVVAQTGLELVFHAHFASMREGDSRGDSAVHDAVAARLRTSRVRVAPTTDIPSSARLARGAALVVSSRYHPAVFAGPGGVPTIGIPVDQYTDVKLRGALGAFGQSGIVPLTAVLEGHGAEAVREVWDAREVTRERGIHLAEQVRPDSDAWWDRVRAAFD
jgi:polysaccharide pyruvyl transferase WcaK-like protein